MSRIFLQVVSNERQHQPLCSSPNFKLKIKKEILLIISKILELTSLFAQMDLNIGMNLQFQLREPFYNLLQIDIDDPFCSKKHSITSISGRHYTIKHINA